MSILELAQTVATVSGKVLNHVPEVTIAKTIDPSEHVNQYVPANSSTRKALLVSEWTALEDCNGKMLSDSGNAAQQ